MILSNFQTVSEYRLTHKEISDGLSVIIAGCYPGTWYVLSMVAAPLGIPTDSPQGSPSSRRYQHLVFLFFLIIASHSNRCEVTAHCGSDWPIHDD